MKFSFAGGEEEGGGGDGENLWECRIFYSMFDVESKKERRKKLNILSQMLHTDYISHTTHT
jgi:hypothetical protein